MSAGKMWTWQGPIRAGAGQGEGPGEGHISEGKVSTVTRIYQLQVSGAPIGLERSGLGSDQGKANSRAPP
jgi:hypothetical protein